MKLGQPATIKLDLKVRIFLGVLALAFIIAFWKEIGGVLRLFWTLVKVALLFPLDEINPAAVNSFAIIFFNCVFGFGFVFAFWLVLISAQALLPVNNLKEVYRTAWHLWLFIIRRHGPAIFVKDGQQVSTQEDSRHHGHGVIVVDFNSSVVLEERDVPPGLTRLVTNTGLGLLSIISLSDPPMSPRVCGPGIVFTRPGERVRGVVDLRKQFRMQPKIHCYTREGIELFANVSAIFTVGANPEPDALQVTFVGDNLPENVRVCTFTQVPGRGGNYLTLTSLKDELDADDREEISRVALASVGAAELAEYGPLAKPSKTPVFDQERVFSAVFAQARNSDLDIIPWTELPSRVAAGFFREILPTTNYDELYDIRGNGKFPLPDYKNLLRLAMRNNGILAYRLVYHARGDQLVEGRVYRTSDLIVSNVRRLTSSKMLRDRGIKVIASGFGDLNPVSPLIYKQRLDSWRANWERELDVTRAGRELQAMRTRSRALADAQQNLWYHLSQLFSTTEYTNEALALRVMQALEEAAADPRTKELLPANALDIMRQMHTLMVPPPPPQVTQVTVAAPPKPLPISPLGND